VLAMLAVIAVGYRTPIASSHRIGMTVVLAMTFSIAIVLIVAWDNPEGGYIAVSEKPLTDLKAELRRQGSFGVRNKAVLRFVPQLVVDG